jgi:2-iminobutanoate/2-iminopropanoate deaminase
MPRTIINAAAAPRAIGPYSQAVHQGDWLFLSGQIPLDPETGTLVPGDVAAQTRRVIANLRAVLTEAGTDFSHVVKTTIYLTDLADFATVNEIYAEVFAAAPPARATVQVAALPLGAQIEIDAIALLSD